ncbi:unnamed protein product [Closterium sp. Naga37s-1]|nr:unnamed protein product [Closterium sp. Naga37s-1]
MDKKLNIKLNANRTVVGVLRGFDQFMNLVLDNTVEMSDQGSDVIDALPAALWHRIFHLLLHRPCSATPPHSAGGRYYCRALSVAQRAEANASKANATASDADAGDGGAGDGAGDGGAGAGAGDGGAGGGGGAGINDPRSAGAGACASSNGKSKSNGKGNDEGTGSAGESDEEEEEKAREKVVFMNAGVSPCWLHAHNARTFGSSWPLMCCALASKRLLLLVASFSVRTMLAPHFLSPSVPPLQTLSSALFLLSTPSPPQCRDYLRD